MALRAIAIFAVAALMFPASTGVARRHHEPRLTVLDAHPLTIHGTSFHRHERVRVVVRLGLGDAFVRRVVASRSGRFSAPFPAVAVLPCGRISVRATGALGSRAVLTGVMRPDCMVG